MLNWKAVYTYCKECNRMTEHEDIEDGMCWDCRQMKMEEEEK